MANMPVDDIRFNQRQMMGLKLNQYDPKRNLAALTKTVKNSDKTKIQVTISKKTELLGLPVVL